MPQNTKNKWTAKAKIISGILTMIKANQYFIDSREKIEFESKAGGECVKILASLDAKRGKNQYVIKP